MGSGFKFDEE